MGKQPISTGRAGRKVARKASNQPKLSGEARSFIVVALACRQAPQAVVEEVRECFGVEITRQSVQRYDPTTYSGRNLPDDLRQLFHSTRAEYFERIRQFGIADRTSRFVELEEIYAHFKERGNYHGALKTLVQAAKEDGGYYAKKRDNTDALRNQLSALTGIPVSAMPPVDRRSGQGRRRG